MEFVVAQLLNGLVYGMLLFLMAAGLSLIFGLMNVVSLAHGSFFMLGAFFGLSIYQFTGSFWLALVLAPIPVAAIGIVMELVFMRPLYRRGHMDQVLLTFGFTFVFFDLVQTVWGRVIVRLPAPEILQGATQIGLGVFSTYRLFLIGLGFAMALLLWLFLDRSRIGAMVRAGVDDAAMAAGLGANIPLLFTGIFGAGVALAALGGVAAGPVLGLYPGMDTEILIPAFIVIVIGGMGSLRGAFVGSLLIGEIDTFGKAYFPSLALFLIYLVMAVVLLVRPQGLFGIKYTGVSGRARGHHREHAGNDADARGRPARDPGDAGLPVPGGGLSARAARRDLHLRHLRHEPRPPARVHRPDVARPRRLLRAGRLRRGDPRDAVRRQRLARARGRRRRCRGRRRGDRLLLRAHDGIPFLMLTLAFSQLVFSVALKWRDVTGGSGRHGDRREARACSASSCRIRSPCISWRWSSSCCRYWGLRRLLNAPLGHVFVGIRENEPRMLAIGYPTRAYKLLSFTIAGAFAGLAGGLYAIFNSFISPDAIYWTSSGDILIMTMLGGAGTLIGPAIGAGVFLLMKNVVSSYSEHWLAIIGIIFICCVMFFPGGIWGTLRQIRLRRRKP